MRIRKRLATAISDLQLQLRSSEAAPPPPPSDPPTQQPDRSCRSWVFSVHDETDDDDHKIKQKEFGDDETWIMEANKSATDDIREIVNICNRDQEGSNKIMHPSSSSSYAHQENKLVPLKKRIGGFERSPSEETILLSAKMKSKTNNKCDDHNNNNNNNNNMRDDDGDDDDDDENETNSGSSTKKKIKRGNVIMEGSRCSRMNGRGWRCHHPTLVGYSLCEHHLGKGRLRNVRHAPPPEKKPSSMVTKKRTKLGVVKARSMSSLLSQI